MGSVNTFQQDSREFKERLRGFQESFEEFLGVLSNSEIFRRLQDCLSKFYKYFIGVFEEFSGVSVTFRKFQEASVALRGSLKSFLRDSKCFITF